MKIVNVKHHKASDQLVYCGRGRPGRTACILANPFSHDRRAKAIRVKDRNAAVEAFRKWLWAALNDHPTVLIDRVGLVDLEIGREKVIEFMRTLTDDSTLGCWCAPQRCHCEVIASCWAWLKRTSQL